jgi:hypothetical protein
LKRRNWVETVEYDYDEIMAIHAVNSQHAKTFSLFFICMHKSINCFSLVVCIAVALQYIDIHVLV